MKNFTKMLVPAIALAIGFTSCDKTTTTTPTPTPTPTPTTPTAPTPISPAPSGYWGVLAAIEMEFTYNMPQLTIPVSITSDIASANFYSALTSGTLVDAGTVSVNDNDLKNNSNSYSVTATTGMTPSSLNLGSTVAWKVGGSGAVSAFTYNHTGSFPTYNGTLPTSITKSSGLEIDLGTNVTNADSVYVVVVGFSGKTIIKAYEVDPTPVKATFTASDLSVLSAAADTSAYVEVVPFTYKPVSLNGKSYMFIKEKAAVAMVSVK